MAKLKNLSFFFFPKHKREETCRVVPFDLVLGPLSLSLNESAHVWREKRRSSADSRETRNEATRFARDDAINDSKGIRCLSCLSVLPYLRLLQLLFSFSFPQTRRSDWPLSFALAPEARESVVSAPALRVH